MLLQTVRASQDATLIQRFAPAVWLSKVFTILLLVVGFSLAVAPLALAVDPSEEIAQPQSLGISVIVDHPVKISFDQAMDTSSVTSNLQMLPNNTPLLLYWSEDASELWISPSGRWRIDQKYLLTVPAGVLQADGTPLPERLIFSFDTQLAPTLSGYRIRDNVPTLPKPILHNLSRVASFEDMSLPLSSLIDEVLSDVSRDSQVVLGFSAPMNREDVEAQFAIEPEAPGSLTWEANELIFTPLSPLSPGTRYTVSITGAHDLHDNVVVDQTSFSFKTREAATLKTTSPKPGAQGVEPDKAVMTFSQPMDVAAVNKAFAMTTTGTNLLVPGKLRWSQDDTVLTYIPDEPFAAGRRYEVRLREGSKDAQGNELIEEWAFTTKAPPPPPTPAPYVPPASAPVRMPAVAPASSLGGYALNQINAARAAYGFAPLYLDGALSAVAQAHANDQLVNGYYSHYTLDGLSLSSRLAAAGLYPSASSENQCHYYSGDTTWVINWCHNAFMSEPYPGLWNHIGNILNPAWRRVGVGVASNGSHTIITWDFAN